MDLNDYELILNEIGQNYAEIRKECHIGCANLLDTHEITLAEKNCLKNCFKKLYYAHNHFNKLSMKFTEQNNKI